MAIPIFTPDDGPTSPAPVPNPSAAAPPSALNSSNGSGTFLNQLVLELYSTYYDYCQIQSVAAVNSRNQSSSGSGGQVLFPAPVPQLPPPQFLTPGQPIEDVNNNFYPTNANENHGLGIASSGSRRRRRHPAGRGGFPDTNRAAADADLVPLSVQLNLESGQDPANMTTTLTELELKVSVAENLSVGISLRHIADSYQVRTRTTLRFWTNNALKHKNVFGISCKLNEFVHFLIFRVEIPAAQFDSMRKPAHQSKNLPKLSQHFLLTLTCLCLHFGQEKTTHPAYFSCWDQRS